MSRYVFKMPDLGEGTVEAEVVAWHVKVGDVVAEDQVIAEVMTEKAAVEVPSPVSGRIVALNGNPGDMVPVGAELIVFETSGGAEAADEAPAAAAPVPAATAAPAPVAAPAPAAKTAPAAAVTAPVAAAIAEAADEPVPSGRIKASPATRRRAREAAWTSRASMVRAPAAGSRGRISMPRCPAAALRGCSRPCPQPASPHRAPAPRRSR